ncbi:MAG: nucleotidyltransferase domain-containing protein [Candidatus Woesearchaeota archaeon]
MTNDVQKIYEEALNKFVYTDKDLAKVEEFMKKVKEILDNEVKNLKLDVEVFLGGSAAKRTFSKQFDLDVFIRFKKLKKNLSDKCELILKNLKQKKIIMDYDRIHGSRDYFKTFIDGIKIEIVPIKYINFPEEAENITDVSPFHVNWFKSVSNEKICKDVVLLKTFLKANRLYGAETFRKGISGYVCEILVVYFGSFIKVIEFLSNTKKDIVIDLERYYDSKTYEEVVKILGESKKGPLIVIDPLDKNRNAAAAFSYENFEKLKQVCNNFLQNPSIDFFNKKPLLNLEKPFYYFKLKMPKGNDDATSTYLVVYFKKLYNFLKEKDFEPELMEYDFDFDKRIAEFVIKAKKNLDRIKIIKGPPLYLSEDVANFKRKYSLTFEENSRIYGKVERKLVDSEDAINLFLENHKLREDFSLIEFTYFN